MWLLRLVGFDAAHKEWMTLCQSLHEQLKRLLELEAESRRSLQRLDALQTAFVKSGHAGLPVAVSELWFKLS